MLDPAGKVFIGKLDIFDDRYAVDDHVEFPGCQLGRVELLVVLVASDELDTIEGDLVPGVGAARDTGGLVPCIDTAAGDTAADFTRGTQDQDVL